MKQVLKRKRIFEGALIKLFLQKQKLPGGFIADLEVVEHPGAALIVPFPDKDRVILIRQYRPVIGSYIWELPAGTLDENESHLHCAKRELIEETGYKAGKWARIGHIYPAPGYTTEKIVIFTARDLREAEAQKDEDEIITVKVFTRDEVSKLLKEGKIVDAKTICALKLAGAV